MKLILKKPVKKLGQILDEVTVKDGYGRNYLLPQGIAVRATKANREQVESQRAQLEARDQELKDAAEDEKSKLDGQKYILIRQASDSGNLYGSVSARDIVEAVHENNGLSVSRAQVELPQPIKELGLHDVEIALHAEVRAKITLNIARSIDEAELQAEGKSIAQLRAEEEVADAEEFDVKSLFNEDADVDFSDDSEDEEKEGV